MKYLVVSDLHGSLYHYRLIKEILAFEKADKLIFLGDYAHFYGIEEECRFELASLPIKPVAIEGNCDNGCGNIPEFDYQGEMYWDDAFSRHLLFTHGDRYNITNVPLSLEKGDVLVYGHTHMGGLVYKNGVFIANCGSLSRPRFGYQPSYIVINNDGIYLKMSENHQILEKIAFSEHK